MESIGQKKGPTRIGPYTLIRRLAVGGMAEIYLAKAAGLGGFEKHLVLKVLHSKYAQDPEFIEMLVQEAKLVVRLNHVNIAQVFDLGIHEDRYYIAMEYVDGLDLYQLLRRCRESKTFIPFEVAATIIAEVCSGLAYAHDRQDEEGRPLDIIHRDISPQNILVSRDGEIKIIDFGIAKARARSTTTGEGIIKGKFFYMSPEQARGEPLDHRSDLFALGNLFYELLTSRMLYNTDNYRDALRLARAATFLPPSSLRPDIPKPLEDIVLKALERNRDTRYSSAHLMRADISAWLRKNAPGFGRHRLADYIKTLFEGSTSGPLASMGRKDFSVEPAQSAIADPSDGLGAPDEGARLLARGTRKVRMSAERQQESIDEPSGPGEPSRDPFRADQFSTRPRIQPASAREPVQEEDVGEGEDTAPVTPEPPLTPASERAVRITPDPGASAGPPSEVLRAALAAWEQSREASTTPPDSVPVSPDQRDAGEPGMRDIPIRSEPPRQTEAAGQVADPRLQLREAVSARLGLGSPAEELQKSTREIPPLVIQAMAEQERQHFAADLQRSSTPPGGDNDAEPGSISGFAPGQQAAQAQLPVAGSDTVDEWERTVDMSETIKEPFQPPAGGLLRPGERAPFAPPAGGSLRPGERAPFTPPAGGSLRPAAREAFAPPAGGSLRPLERTPFPPLAGGSLRPGAREAFPPLSGGISRPGAGELFPPTGGEPFRPGAQEPFPPSAPAGRAGPTPTGAAAAMQGVAENMLDTVTEVQIDAGQLPRPKTGVTPVVQGKEGKGQWIALAIIAIAAIAAFVVFLVLAVGEPAAPVVSLGNIQVDTAPSQGAEIKLDGVPTGLTSPVLLTGVSADEPHEVRAWLPGFQEAVVPDVRVVQGGTRAVQLTLIPALYSATIESQPPGAEILVNNAVVGRTPAQLTNIDLEGKDGLRILLRLPGHRLDLFTIRWPPGETHVRQHRVLTPGP